LSLIRDIGKDKQNYSIMLRHKANIGELPIEPDIQLNLLASELNVSAAN
jgi:hypothetical protein